jgi:uncharacterized phage infection (PIP) family protein YhgE
MTQVKFIPTLIVAVAAVTIVVPSASAKTTRVEGHVIAPPTAKGKRTSVPLLLTERSERRLKLRRGIVRVLVAPRARLSAPGPGGKGSVTLTPSALQAGDRVQAVAKLSRKQVKRLRKRSVPAFAVRRVSVVARASSLSNDDLARMIAELDARLTALSQRVDGMAASNADQFASLRSDLDSLAARTGVLESSFASLGGSLDELLARIDLLEGLVDPELLAALQDDVDSLLGRTGALEGVTGGLTTSLAGLTGTVGGLETSLDAIDSQLDPLLTTVDSLSGRLDDADGVLAQVPGILSQIDGIESGLSTLTGRVEGSELLLDTLGGTVDGLTGTVDGLTDVTDSLLDTATQQGLDIDALQGSVSTLTTNLTTVTNNLLSLQGTVGSLGTTVSGLTTSVGTLTGQVAGLQGTLNLLCGVPLIGGVCD